MNESAYLIESMGVSPPYTISRFHRENQGGGEHGEQVLRSSSALSELSRGRGEEGCALMRPDWTVPMDDMLTERHRPCLLCGRVAQWMDIGEVEGRAYFCCLCARCYASGQGWGVLEALLATRSLGWG